MLKEELNNNEYTWQELKDYLKGFVNAQVERDMNNESWTALGYTEEQSREHAIENLEESLSIIFPDHNYKDKEEQIKTILDKYGRYQSNLSSEWCQKMITREISKALRL
jgi:hypothetical protein